MGLQRILILDTSPIRRGAQVFAEELARSLESKGNEVRRVYLFFTTQSQTVSLEEYDKVLPFSEDSFQEKFPSFQLEILRKLKTEIETFKPQVILCNGSKTLKYGAWLKIFGVTAKAKVVGRFIDDATYWNEKGPKKWAYKYWLNRLDGVVSVSEASSKTMIRHYSFQKPSTVIHRVFDPGKFENAPNRGEARKLLGIGTEEEVVLFLGNLTAQKRPDRFLEIVSQLSKSRPKLKALLVGDGVLRKELENKVASCKYQVSRDGNSLGFDLRSSIVFAGYQQDVSSFLAAADVLVLTSDTEGLPGVVLEAAHFKVPAVCTAVGGIGECLIDGETGFLIPDRSVDAFCEKINFLLDYSEARKSMGERAAAFVSTNFKMDLVAQQYLDFFDSLLLLGDKERR